MRNFITACLTFCLTLQLATTSVSIPIPNFIFGNTSNRTISAKKEVFRQQPTAILADENVDNYESIVFVGDIMLARKVEYLMNEKGNDYPFAGFEINKLRSHPAIFGNFEASVPDTHEYTPAGSFTFSVKEISAQVLSNVGFTHLSLGNNHSFDYGVDGYINTIETLSSSGINVFGNEKSIEAESITYLRVNDKKIAVIGVNLLMRPNDSELKKLITHAAKRSDIQIAYVHWGEEYDLHHSTEQEKQAKVMIEAGVDLVVGHHPHVTQDIGVVDGVPVFYSLGNYIFDQYFSKDVQEGLVLALNYDNGFLIDIIPVSSQTTLSQPSLMSPEKHADFLTALAKKSDIQLQETIALGRINLQNLVASSTKMAIIN